MKKFITLFLSVMMTFSMTSCDDDDKILPPSFGEIIISPAKETYRVGDVVTCSIRRTSAGSGDLRGSSYWWYTSWWFADSEMKADFTEFSNDETCESSPITLTHPGTATLYFFGKLDYPHYDSRKIEIAKTITVTE